MVVVTVVAVVVNEVVVVMVVVVLLGCSMALSAWRPAHHETIGPVLLCTQMLHTAVASAVFLLSDAVVGAPMSSHLVMDLACLFNLNFPGVSWTTSSSKPWAQTAILHLSCFARLGETSFQALTQPRR